MSAHNNLHALLYYATSAEQIALTTQLYQLARYALLERLGQRRFRNPAVILDLDETVLNNTAYQAWLIQSGSNYEDSTWNAWCDAAEADAISGAAEFIAFATANGVTPIFITSRQNQTRSGTSRYVYTTRLFMKGMSAVIVSTPGGNISYSLENKYFARIFCEQVRRFEIILSIGDNLSDYAEYYGVVVGADGQLDTKIHPTARARRQAVLQDVQLFGRDFILMPNSAYGGWLRAFEANKIGASDELAFTTDQVREPLVEPQEEFVLANGKVFKAIEPKFAPKHLRIWGGPGAPKSPPAPLSSVG
jgi:5'-nucleotidase (lipoprotein e(P4) family)